MKKTVLISLCSLFMIVGFLSCTEHPAIQQCEKNLNDEKQAVINTLLTRRSIRAYQAQPVPDSIMEVILDCGIHAPNGMNRQPWEIRVISDTAFLNGLTRLHLLTLDPDDPRNYSKDSSFRNMFRNAPTLVFIGMKEGRCSQVDCGLLAGNMVNAAWAYGIGSCIQMAPVTFMDSESAQPYMERLNFSEDYQLLMVIGFGYPAQSPDAKPRDTTKIQFIR